MIIEQMIEQVRNCSAQMTTMVQQTASSLPGLTSVDRSAFEEVAARLRRLSIETFAMFMSQASERIIELDGALIQITQAQMIWGPYYGETEIDDHALLWTKGPALLIRAEVIRDDRTVRTAKNPHIINVPPVPLGPGEATVLMRDAVIVELTKMLESA